MLLTFLRRGDIIENVCNMAITLADVAREAKVDVSTASRALNGRSGISQEVRERVASAAERLNYRPNLVARGLVTGRSSAIGLLVSDIRNPYFAELARGAEDACREAGYDVVLCNSDMDPGKQMRYFRSLLDKRAGGIIMNSVAPLSQADRKQIASSTIPVVLLSRAARERTFSSVTCDNEHGGYLAGAYLAGLGHTKVAHLTGEVRHPNLEERWRGFVKAFQRATPSAKPVLLLGEHNSRGGFAMAQELLKLHPDVTAIFAGNDDLAFGAARALNAAGVRIPEDISLIGFDGASQGAFAHPPLTTISQPIYEIGKAAVEILTGQINRRDRIPEHRTFGVRLLERDSCGRPPAPARRARKKARPKQVIA